MKRLKAEEVAGTIKFLMGVSDKKEEDNRRRFYYDPWGFNNDNKKKKDDSFRVGANVQDNQVLIWANEIERQEISKLLIKLGELPPEGGRTSPIRVIEASKSPATFEYLKRLQERWEKLSPNELVLPPEELFTDDDDAESLREKIRKAQEKPNESLTLLRRTSQRMQCRHLRRRKKKSPRLSLHLAASCRAPAILLRHSFSHGKIV